MNTANTVAATTDAQANKPFSRRVRDWLALPASERRRRLWKKVTNPVTHRLASAILRRGGSLGNTFLAFHPDSHVYSGAHPELARIAPRFLEGNRVHNAGDMVRLWTLILNIKHVLERGIPGDFAELGVYRGNVAAVLAMLAASAGRRVQLFDTFQGFDARDFEGVDSGTRPMFDDSTIQYVRQVVGDDVSVCDFVPGYFPESLRPEHDAKRYAVVSIDCDLYKPMIAGLEYFYPRLSQGGIIFVHDYSSPIWLGAKQAVDEFCARHGEEPFLVADKCGTAVIRRSR